MRPTRADRRHLRNDPQLQNFSSSTPYEAEGNDLVSSFVDSQGSVNRSRDVLPTFTPQRALEADHNRRPDPAPGGSAALSVSGSDLVLDQLLGGGPGRGSSRSGDDPPRSARGSEGPAPPPAGGDPSVDGIRRRGWSRRAGPGPAGWAVRPRLVVNLVAWTAVGSIFAAQELLLARRFGTAMTVQGALLEGFADAYLWMLLTPLLVMVVERYPFERKSWLRRLAVHLAVGTAAMLVFLVTSTGLMVALDAFAGLQPMGFLDGMLLVGVLKTRTLLLPPLVVLATANAAIQFRRSKARELRAVRLERLLAQARLEALRSRLNPHFLFNTLNGIAELLHEDPDRAEAMVTGLSTLLRQAFASADRQEVELEAELEIVLHYLAIHRQRWGDRLRTEIVVPDELLTALVPSMSLQPLVENAVVHGVAVRPGGGRIRLVAAQRGERLELTVVNDCPEDPYAGSTQRQSGVGLSATRERLEQLYGDDHELRLHRLDDGRFAATLNLPLRTSPQGDETAWRHDSR